MLLIIPEEYYGKSTAIASNILPESITEKPEVTFTHPKIANPLISVGFKLIF